jgi:hypothetical protein
MAANGEDIGTVAFMQRRPEPRRKRENDRNAQR